MSKGELVQFEYVKSIGQNICPLNLYGGKEPSGENIYAMCEQGPIYVRACQALKVWVLSECFESENSNGASTEEEGNTLSSSPTSHRHCTGRKRRKQSNVCVNSQGF